MNKQWIILILVVFLLPSVWWVLNQIQIHTVSGTGTIEFIDLEGGFYGIKGDDGNNYDPINLDQDFRVDGLRVRFTAKVSEEQASIHMWGIIIEIVEIEEIS